MCVREQVSVKHCSGEQPKRSLPILKKRLPTSPITQRSLSTLSISSWCIDLSIGQTGTLEYIPETLARFLRIRECDLEGLGSEQSKETSNALCDYNVRVQENNSEGTE